MTAAAAPAPRPVLPPSAARGAAGAPVVQAVPVTVAPVAARAPEPEPRAAVPAMRVAAETAAPAPAPRAPAPATLRDDPVERHPVVRMVAELFDAAVVRVDAAGTLGQQPTERADPGDDEAGDTDV